MLEKLFSFLQRQAIWITLLFFILGAAGWYAYFQTYSGQNTIEDKHPFSDPLRIVVEYAEEEEQNIDTLFESISSTVEADEIFTIRSGSLGSVLDEFQSLYYSMNELLWLQDSVTAQSTEDLLDIQYKFAEEFILEPVVNQEEGRGFPELNEEISEEINNYNYEYTTFEKDFSVFAGSEKDLTFIVQNTGNTSWKEGEVFLMTNSPYRYRSSLYVEDKWLGESVIIANDREVAIGEEYAFTISVAFPEIAGEYQDFNFGLGLARNDTWYPIEGNLIKETYYVFQKNESLFFDASDEIATFPEKTVLPQSKYFLDKDNNILLLYAYYETNDRFSLQDRYQQLNDSISSIEQKGFTFTLHHPELVPQEVTTQWYLKILIAFIFIFIVSLLILLFLFPSFLSGVLHTVFLASYLGISFIIVLTGIEYNYLLLYGFLLLSLCAVVMSFWLWHLRKYYRFHTKKNKENTYEYIIQNMPLFLKETSHKILWVSVLFCVFSCLMFLTEDMNIVYLFVYQSTLFLFSFLFFYPALIALLVKYTKTNISTYSEKVWGVSLGIDHTKISAYIITICLLIITLFIWGKYSHTGLYTSDQFLAVPLDIHEQKENYQNIFDTENTPLVFSHISKDDSEYIVNEIIKKPYIDFIESIVSFLPSQQVEKIPVINDLNSYEPQSVVVDSLLIDQTNQDVGQLLRRCKLYNSIEENANVSETCNKMSLFLEKLDALDATKIEQLYNQNIQEMYTQLQKLPQDLRPVGFENIPEVFQSYLLKDTMHSVYVYPNDLVGEKISWGQFIEEGTSIYQDGYLFTNGGIKNQFSLKYIILIFLLCIFIWSLMTLSSQKQLFALVVLSALSTNLLIIYSQIGGVFAGISLLVMFIVLQVILMFVSNILNDENKTLHKFSVYQLIFLVLLSVALFFVFKQPLFALSFFTLSFAVGVLFLGNIAEFDSTEISIEDIKNYFSKPAGVPQIKGLSFPSFKKRVAKKESVTIDNFANTLQKGLKKHVVSLGENISEEKEFEGNFHAPEEDHVLMHKSMSKKYFNIDFELGTEVNIEDIEVYVVDTILHVYTTNNAPIKLERHIEIEEDVDFENIEVTLNNEELVIRLPRKQVIQEKEPVQEKKEVKSEEVSSRIEKKESVLEKAKQMLNIDQIINTTTKGLERQIESHIQQEGDTLTVDITLDGLAVEDVNIEMDTKHVFVNSKPQAIVNFQKTIDLPHIIDTETIQSKVEESKIILTFQVKNQKRKIEIQGEDE